MKTTASITLLLSIIIFTISNCYGQRTLVEFNENDFQIFRGEVAEHAGRTAFKGVGAIKDLDFTNGIIEVDMYITGERSYPGINFRVQSQLDYEHFYIRPHRTALYPDAAQYTPCSNGIDSWQLFSGPGYTSMITVPKNEWFHVRLVVKDNQAVAYFNNEEKPSLEIYNLYHGISSGMVTLVAPNNNTAWFSNLSYTITDDITLEKAPPIEKPLGLISDWEITSPMSVMDAEFDKHPGELKENNLNWTKATPDLHGFINVANYFSRVSRATDFIYARTNLFVEKDTLMEIKFGYSDAIQVFLNGEKVFYGSSGYQQRDPSFLGIIGLNDVLYLPLKKGNNELALSVAESFGGWGFIFAYGSNEFLAPGLEMSWQTEKEFLIPESILYDDKREVIYVTNFDQMNMGNPAISQYISKLDLEGNIIEKEWVKGLNNPLGMIIKDDIMRVCERSGIAVIDLKNGEIIERIPVPGCVFLNDIAIDGNNNLYLSDSRINKIWKITGEKSELFLEGPEVSDPNTMLFHNGQLLFGNSDDGWLKAVDTETKEITKVARFPKGFIDGIKPLNDEELLVSLWKGKIYRVRKDGKVTLFLNCFENGEYSADFEFIQQKGLLIVPGFYSNRVTGYKYNH